MGGKGRGKGGYLAHDNMRINENTTICGDKVILVPYRSASGILSKLLRRNY